jgi:chitinase
LDGSGSSDPDGHLISFQWTQTSGIPVTLNDASAVAPSFTSSATPGDLTFQLTVTDTYGLSDSDNVTITIVEGYYLYLPLILP